MPNLEWLISKEFAVTVLRSTHNLHSFPLPYLIPDVGFILTGALQSIQLHHNEIHMLFIVVDRLQQEWLLRGSCSCRRESERLEKSDAGFLLTCSQDLVRMVNIDGMQAVICK